MSKINVLSLHRGQREIVDGISNSGAKWHVVSCGRQFGKTLMSQALMVMWMLSDRGSRGIWISPYASQSESVYFDIVQRCGKYIKSSNSQNKRIVWYNNSTLVFKSAENYESIRGGWYHYGVIDEAAFMRGEAYPVIRPVFSVKGKKVLVISTPFIKNWFYDYYLLGQNQDESNFVSYKAISIDNPFFPVSDLREAERTQPHDIVRQEYYAEFLETGGEVFREIASVCTIGTYQKGPIEGHLYVFGIDWGADSDKSVLTIVDATLGCVAFIRESTSRHYPTIVDEFAGDIERFGCEGGLAEYNGVGRSTFDFLKQRIDGARAFVMSNKTKREAVSSLRQSIELGEFSLPTMALAPKLFKQMSVYQVKATAGGKVTYGHPDGEQDDWVDSLMIAKAAADKYGCGLEAAIATDYNQEQEPLSDALWDYQQNNETEETPFRYASYN